MALMKGICKCNQTKSLKCDEDYKFEFEAHVSGYNFRRARVLLLLVLLFACALLVNDYFGSQLGRWAYNHECKQLLQWHLILGVGTGLLLIVSFFIKLTNDRSQVRTAFTLFTAFFILCQPAFLSGGMAHLVQQQTTGYFLLVFGIAAGFYIRPVYTLFLYLVSYLFFAGGLHNFRINEPWITLSSVEGLVFILIAWLVSAKLYDYAYREFLNKKIVDNSSEKRIAWLEEDRNINQEKAYRLASIVESTNDGIVGMTTDGIVTYWNPGAVRVYGYAETEIVGKSIFSIVPEDLQEESKEVIASALRGEKVTNYETRRISRDRGIIDISLSISLIKDNYGKVLGISSIVRDIGEEKRMEQELIRLDRLNLIGELAAGISHEVRNPMATVRGFIQLLKEKEGCKDYDTYFDLMVEELDRANGILTEFLSISHNKKTERQWRNLNEVIKSLLPLLEANAVGSDKRIRAELGELPQILMDDKEIRQVILNLSRNGLEAMSAGGVLSIRTYCWDEQVVLEIADQGHGISPEIIERLGTPFFTTKSEGTGLGLAICYGIANRHNAMIQVESSDSGTTFKVIFPHYRH